MTGTSAFDRAMAITYWVRMVRRLNEKIFKAQPRTKPGKTATVVKRRIASNKLNVSWRV
jgi:hypothetical protein